MTGAELRRVSFAKVKRYNVSIAEVEQRTSIDFGASERAADTHDDGERPEIGSLEDLIGLPEVPAKTKSGKVSSARKRPTPKRNY